MEGKRQITRSLHEKIDHMFVDLSSKFGPISTHVQKPEVQIGQTAEAAEKQHEVNPQNFCSVVSSLEDQLAIVPIPSQEGEEEDELKENHKPERYTWESRRSYKRRLENKPLPKVEDPEKFVIPACISGYLLNDFLRDIGANVNLMSHALAKDLGFKYFKDPKMRVEFADLSSMEPYGVLENVMLEIGGRLVLTDLHIMAWEGSKRNQLILGTLFLATAGAVINYLKNQLSLGNIRQDVFFPSINFKSGQGAVKLPPEKATIMPNKVAVLPKDPKKSKSYPKPKEVMKPSKLKHEAVFKDISSVLSPNLDEHGDKEEPDGVPKYAHIRVLFPKGSKPQR